MESTLVSGYRYKLKIYPDLSPSEYAPKLFNIGRKRADETVSAYASYTLAFFSPAILLALTSGSILDDTISGGLASILMLAMGTILSVQVGSWFKERELRLQWDREAIWKIWLDHQSKLERGSAAKDALGND